MARFRPDFNLIEKIHTCMTATFSRAVYDRLYAALSGVYHRLSATFTEVYHRLLLRSLGSIIGLSLGRQLTRREPKNEETQKMEELKAAVKNRPVLKSNPFTMS